MGEVLQACVAGLLGAVVFPFINERLARPQRAILITLWYSTQPLSIRDLRSELEGSLGPATVNQALMKLERSNRITAQREPDGIKFELPPSDGPPRDVIRIGVRVGIIAIIGFAASFVAATVLLILLNLIGPAI